MTTEQNDTIESPAAAASEKTEKEQSAAEAESAEEYEACAGNQMWRLNETRKQLEGDDRLAEATAELGDALAALGGAYEAVDFECRLDGTSDEDAAAQALVADELAAINRRLDMLLALAAVRAAARGLGRAVCRPEAAGDESDAVEH